MPRSRRRILLPLLLACACSPAQFVWDEGPSAELDAYLASFGAAAGTAFDRRLSYDEMLGALGDVRILWLGDHHRSARLHGLQRELLALLQQRGVRLALLLEAIGTQDEPAVGDWLRGDRPLSALQADVRARWPGAWLSADDDLDAAFYRELLVFARTHAIPVSGLEPTPRAPIRTRDAAIAERVRAAAQRWPDRLLVVVVGQAHLLGQGDLIARTELGGIALGGLPPARLQATAVTRDDRGFWRSNGGLWWFGELLATAR